MVSVNTSTANAPIKNQTKRGDPLKCNISSANSNKKLHLFCIAGCEMIVMGWSGVLATPPITTVR